MILQAGTATLAEKKETEAEMWVEARSLMVDDQLRPTEITNPLILKAMRSLPRELCVLPQQQAAAYADTSLPLSAGRVLAQPLLTARLLQAADPQKGEQALVVGAGTGYAAGLLASLGLSVTALESDSALAAQGQSFCQQLGLNVTWNIGPLDHGVPDNAPYDLIYFDGALCALPEFCTRDLAPKGRIVGLLQKAGKLPEIFRAREVSDETNSLMFTFLAEARVPVLPGLEAERQFTF